MNGGRTKGATDSEQRRNQLSVTNRDRRTVQPAKSSQSAKPHAAAQTPQSRVTAHGPPFGFLSFLSWLVHSSSVSSPKSAFGRFLPHQLQSPSCNTVVVNFDCYHHHFVQVVLSLTQPIASALELHQRALDLDLTLVLGLHHCKGRVTEPHNQTRIFITVLPNTVPPSSSLSDPYDKAGRQFLRRTPRQARKICDHPSRTRS